MSRNYNDQRDFLSELLNVSFFDIPIPTLKAKILSKVGIFRFFRLSGGKGDFGLFDATKRQMSQSSTPIMEYSHKLSLAAKRHGAGNWSSDAYETVCLTS